VKTVGLLVGSGELPWDVQWQPVDYAASAYGEASMIPQRTELAGMRLVRINRHGVPHRIAPHAINYRANLAALAAQSVDAIVALNTVGGIAAHATSGSLLIADQLIDYTWGRALSFAADDAVEHIDFSHPYDAHLNEELVAAAASIDLVIHQGGTMAVTQGPRLETAAEIRRLAQDGCAVVGMTGMPEAALARELGIPFACICLVVNRAAGLGDTEQLDLQQMHAVSQAGMRKVAQLLVAFFERQR
jgi:5'-methylthioinosine phosphorylase